MHDQAFKILEFDQLREIIRRNAQTPMGQTRVDELQPFADRAQLATTLRAIDECLQLRTRGLRWSFSQVSDPRNLVARLKVHGTTLEAAQILEVGRLCDQAMAARAVILPERDNATTLWHLVERLPRDLSSLTARIANKILPSGEIDDRASPELASIRHQIARLRSSITRSLEGLMQRSAEAIQDELVTLRNDRFVIPVKADHRARIQGVAHGFSSSGATAFVEPMETVEANNELQGLREREQREIFHILSSLTEELRQHLPAIEMAVEAVAELDFLNAKAAFSQTFNCSVPSIESQGDDSHITHLELIEARHPLLEENLRFSGGEVVPVSFALAGEYDCMVISGPNAGGKTVVLKTAGLLSLMALSGLPVPAAKASIPFYKSILADIGDHQSLAANLSTFTSHISNISQMLELCEAPALVLLDEVGTGTDPDEGSALGVAVVDHFRKVCGSHVIATTHYSGLKMYAAAEEGVLNASVEFDEQTLQPTYRLIVGIAGASSGLEIARRFGVPSEIVETSLRLVKDSSRRAAAFLAQTKREAEHAKALRQALEEERRAVAEKFSELERKAEKSERTRQIEFERELEQATSNFEERSRQLLTGITDKAERLKLEREVKKRAAEFRKAVSDVTRGMESRDKTGAGVRVIRDGKELTTASQGAESGKDKPTFIIVNDRDINVGDKVRLRSLGSIGVVEQIKHGEAEVRVKSLRFREKLGSLELVEELPRPPTPNRRFSKLRPTQPTEVVRQGHAEEAELNVIGQKTDEAVDILDKFLDNAFMNSVTRVRIVHGHGTGALRRAIGEHLKHHPHVERFMLASPQSGGTGATIVELKQ